MATAIDQRIPPLAPGDKLTREEFLHRWEAQPEIKNAELIGGMVFMAFPVSVQHGDMEGDIGGWLWSYKAATPGTACGHNTTSFNLEDTPQPDVNLRILPEYGGAAWVEDKFLHGIPELLAEISRSSVAYDMHVKLALYQAARTPEYLAILLHEQEIRWHVVEGDRYQLLAPDADGLWRSRIFPGLWLDGQALLAGNMPQVLARLQDGLASPEHQAFVAELARRRQSKDRPA
jgi:Uma2 family endonuclease